MEETTTTRNQDIRDHLAKVRALSLEMSTAIAAIEHNDLQKLENSLALQETLSRELTTRSPLSPANAAHSANSLESDAELVHDIHYAYLGLAKLNRVYAAVLKRSRRAADLIASVYRIHGQVYAKDSPAIAGPRSWSCEV